MNAKKAGSASLDSLSELRRIPANCEKANRKIECKKKKNMYEREKLDAKNVLECRHT